MCALTASKNTPADWADTDPTGQECFSMFRSLPPQKTSAEAAICQR